MRIGILGGSFDPPHVGHLLIARQAAERLRLDRVYFIPTAIAPHKRQRTSAAGVHRIAMLRKAIAGVKTWKCLTIEVARGGVSYTVDTLRALRRLHPHARFTLIIGSDNLSLLHTWREPRAVVRLAKVAVYQRPGETADRRALRRWKAVDLRGIPLAWSSTEIRDRVRRGRSIRWLVPKPVEQYVRKHRLYR